MVDVRSGGILWSMSSTATKPATVMAMNKTVTDAANEFVNHLVKEMVDAFVQQKPTVRSAQATP